MYFYNHSYGSVQCPASRIALISVGSLTPVITPFSYEMESPANPGRFTMAHRPGLPVVAAACDQTGRRRPFSSICCGPDLG